MPRLLHLDAARQAVERRRATTAEAAVARWRRSWHRVFAQCVGLMLLGYVGYGASWALIGNKGALLAAACFVVAYVLPFLRLLAFFVHNADQF